MNIRVVGVVVLLVLGLSLLVLWYLPSWDGLSDSSASIVSDKHPLCKEKAYPTSINAWIGIYVPIWYNSSTKIEPTAVTLNITYPNSQSLSFHFEKTTSPFGEWGISAVRPEDFWFVPSHVDIYTFTFMVSTSTGKTLTDVFYAKIF